VSFLPTVEGGGSSAGLLAVGRLLILGHHHNHFLEV
jgi:hypothetical protein